LSTLVSLSWSWVQQRLGRQEQQGRLQLEQLALTQLERQAQ
jgi:hypothetical protein